MSAALARAAVLARATVHELHGESAGRRADRAAAAAAKAEALALSAQARSKDAASAAAEASLQATVSELQALAETQRAQGADAKSSASAAATALSAVLSQRTTSAETAEVRIRELQRAVSEGQAEVERLQKLVDSTDLYSVDLQQRLEVVHHTQLATEAALSSRETLLLMTKRDFASMILKAEAEVAASRSAREGFEAQTRVALERTNAECRRAQCAESAAVAKCTLLEAALAARSAEADRLTASVAKLRASVKEAATERAEMFEALQQSSDACAALQAELMAREAVPSEAASA